MLTAREIMTTDVVTVKPETSLKELANKFVETRFSNMPVVDADGDLVGVISETDLVEQQKPLHIPTVMALFDGVFYLDSEKSFKEQVDRVTATTVGELCNRKPVTCAPGTPVREIAGLMSKHKIHLIPVVDGGRMVGVVARLDLIRAMEA
ncbi:CBS domain-containing protein [Malonomonas rubra DSM 5091]|uniref:CBS domain-containing protein n=1 Tax=Malonomonas rubra DSM 5091 TaxID=1122189 RepID=A0A1M6F0M8_MALRU|nr:CBS domain-containing protein [Malonomonas rubra]SHI91230.1 CBS domain-containing protein [Malonomonas rubra DSM 5091]